MRSRHQGRDALVKLIHSQDAIGSFRFTIPTIEDLSRFDTDHWVAYTLSCCRIELQRAGVFKDQKVSEDNSWTWAYLFMKCKDYYENTTSTKRSKTTDARKENALRREGDIQGFSIREDVSMRMLQKREKDLKAE